MEWEHHPSVGFRLLLEQLAFDHWAKILHEEIFLNDGPVPLHQDGKPDFIKIILEALALEINLRNISNNPHNRSAGFSFLEHPANAS
jgi:hypothetical protein